MKKRSVEILAPAGSFESMKAAVAAGADAVYIGGSRFGARAYADNPDEDRLLEAIDYAHLHGSRLYMTVNTLVKESELPGLRQFLAPYYRRGLDAAIVQDMGVFSCLRRYFPDLAIHASTQMTVTGARGAALLADMGAARIVTARELSLEEIRRIHEETDVEIESFVHGALCYCYSGQCLFSSLIGGRSGNRGRCAQTCRLPFEVKRDGRTLNKREERYVLSLKDLCTLDILPDILEAGVYSLKIEGRMKSPRYTAGVVRIYRKYADRYLEHGRAGYRVDEADRKELLDLFDRGGQTEGYYRRHNGRDMVVLKEKPAFREENRELYRYLDETYVEAEQKLPVTGEILVREGEPMALSLSCERKLAGRENEWEQEAYAYTTAVSHTPVQSAMNQPIDAPRIEKQIRKTGNTPFYFETLKTELAGRPFVPVQELNELRRRGFDSLLEEILKPWRREKAEETDGEIRAERTAEISGAESQEGRTEQLSDEEVRAERMEQLGGAEDQSGRKEGLSAANAQPAMDAQSATDAQPAAGGSSMRLHVSLENPDLFDLALNTKEVSAIYLDSAEFDASQWRGLAARCHAVGKECFLLLPHIFREEAERYFQENRSLFLEAGFDGVVLRSWEELGLIKEWKAGLPILADYPLYTMNREAEAFIREMVRGAGGKNGNDGESGKQEHQIPPLRFTVPVELNSRELRERGCEGAELMVYGRLPMMVTAQCMEKTVGTCLKKKPDSKTAKAAGRHAAAALEIGTAPLYLRDRKGKEFPVRHRCRFCYNTIYNSAPLSLLREKKTIDSLNPASIRIAFTTESQKEAGEVLDAFAGRFFRGEDSELSGEFTRGHFSRGVE